MRFLPFIFLLSFSSCKDSEHKPFVSAKVEEVKVEEVPPQQITPLDETVVPSLPWVYPARRGGGGGGGRKPGLPFTHFIPNSYEFWTDPRNATTYLLEGCTGSDCTCTPGTPNCKAIPAFADILVEPENFVWCKGGPFALCYYSGPSDGTTDLSCKLTKDGRYANCKCFEIPWGAYMVDINAILNYGVYQATIEACGADGSGCSGPDNVNKAPVCQSVNANTLIPGADMVSTFSFDCVPTDGIGSTNCQANLYAGCMTAPCKRTGTDGIVECSCPTYNGPYQVGSTIEPERCLLGNDLVWSAAYSPAGTTIPPQSPCIPDAPGGNGCPLLDTNFTPSTSPDCPIICEAYACQNANGIEPAFTCDATLCTGQCNERPLIKEACEDLGDCPAAGIIAIANLEAAEGCSCCASQLCGCTPNDLTNNAIYDLNQRQLELSITPQCSINQTLCGAPPPSIAAAGNKK